MIESALATRSPSNTASYLLASLLEIENDNLIAWGINRPYGDYNIMSALSPPLWKAHQSQISRGVQGGYLLIHLIVQQ